MKQPTSRHRSLRLAEPLGVLLLATMATPFVLQAAPWTIGHEAAFVVVSGSMTGTFEAGDLVFVKDVEPGDLEIGDVIAYRDPQGHVVTHRIMTIGASGIVTKGDANRDPDPVPVQPEQVVGTYSFRVPYYGQAAATAGTGLVPLILVYAIGIPLLVWETRNLMKGRGATRSRRTRGPTHHLFIASLLVCSGLWAAASDLEPATATFHDDESTTTTWQACIPPKGIDPDRPGSGPGSGPGRPPGTCKEGK